MENTKLVTIAGMLGLVTLTCSMAMVVGRAAAEPEKKVEGVVPMKALPFELEDVRLLDGPFKHALELNRQALLRYEPDRLLARFRLEAGLEAKVEHYAGWESRTVSGHSLGHHLSACALTYAATGDERFKQRVDSIVDELARCQEAHGDGYVSAIAGAKKIFEEEIARGKIDSKGFGLNGLWVPLYTQHKVLAGLHDAYRICGNRKALEVARGFADWLEKTLAGLDEDRMQKILACEHGGINEVLADLYADTGDERYLALSRRMHHKAVLDPLSEKVDCLPGMHANTQVPKLVGLARRYELTGDAKDRATAEFFWDRVANHHSYVTGGNGLNEHFGPPDTLNDRLGPNTTESCNVYNMLKLTRHVFQWQGSAEVADFYERALYNHILSSQHPVDGRVIYNLTLEMGGFKRYQDPYGFTCCVGTGMENHTKYGKCIYFHDAEGLFVNLFIASELDWKEKGLKLRQETRFPDEATTTLRFDCEQPLDLALRIRWPYWAEKGFRIKVNGEPQPAGGKPSSYVEIDRQWKTGDVVEIEMPMTLRLEAMPDNPNRVAVMHGPLVLAGDLGAVDAAEATSPTFVPALVTEGRPAAEWLEAVEGKPNTFRTVDVGRPRDVTLIPFFRMHERRYTIFWDLFTGPQWEQRQAQYKAEIERQRKLEALTVDFVQPGEMQPERDHNMQGEKTGAGRHQGRAWRHAVGGGWFSFDLQVLPGEPVILQATYWGDENIERNFDVLVDGEKIATQKLLRNQPGKFFDVDYPLPAERTEGKTRVTVKFQGHPGNMAGGLFGLRVLRTQ